MQIPSPNEHGILAQQDRDESAQGPSRHSAAQTERVVCHKSEGMHGQEKLNTETDSESFGVGRLISSFLSYTTSPYPPKTMISNGGHCQTVY